MKVIIQRVTKACVNINNSEKRSIEKGFVVLVGITHTDIKDDADFLAKKCCGLRVFEDENEKMNLSLKDVGGELLVVSQFTLYGNLKEGNRPSYCTSMPADEARNLFEYFKGKLLEKWPQAQFGIFQADMLVSFTNVGPSTFILDSEELFNE